MIHGLIAIDKPKDITSHTVVEKVRRIFKIQKVGHFGTLDPLAEGLLLVGLGKATKFFNFYIKKTKLYSGVIKFGFATSTFDCEGDAVSEKKEVDLASVNIKEVLSKFTGPIIQTPPIYSAKKVNGKPLYKYAREQKSVEIKPINVEVFSLKTIEMSKDTLTFEALTSSGTYIRSLANDIGEEIGVGGHLQDLRRLKIGEFHVEKAFTLDVLAQEVEKDNLAKVVTPIEALLPEFHKIIVNQEGRRAVLNGQYLVAKDILRVFSSEKTENVRLFDDEGKLLAIAKKDEKLMRFKPYIVFPE